MNIIRSLSLRCVLSAIGILLLLPATCLTEKTELNFSYSGCNTWKPGLLRGHIEKIYWEKNTLHIRAIKKGNCSITGFSATHTIDGNIIHLDARATRGETVFRCHCNFQLSYAITGLKRKDYHLIPSWTLDRLTITADNKVLDTCSETPDFACYKTSLMTPYQQRRQKRQALSDEPIFTFAKKQYEKLSSNQPEFIALFRKHAVNNFSPYCGHYHFDLVDSPHKRTKGEKYITCNSCGERKSINAWGTNFGDAIHNFVKEHQKRYGPNSFAEKLSEKLGLSVYYISDRMRSIQFLYKQENIKYRYRGNGLSQVFFLDRIGSIFFSFNKGGKPIGEISLKELRHFISTADRFYQLVKNEAMLALIDMRSCNVHIATDIDTARLRCMAYRKKEKLNEWTYIHNRRVLVTHPQKQDFEISISRGSVRALPQKNG